MGKHEDEMREANRRYFAKQPKWGDDAPYKDGNIVTGTDCRTCYEPDGNHNDWCPKNN